MTVAELIEILKTMPQDAPVTVAVSDCERDCIRDFVEAAVRVEVANPRWAYCRGPEQEYVAGPHVRIA